MSLKVEEVFQALDNRYPQAEELEYLLRYSESIAGRLAVLREIEAKEALICKETTDKIVEVYPKIAARIDGYEKTERDLVLILRYCAQAYLKADPQFLEDQLLHWLRTMLVAFKFGQNVLRDSYIWLKERSQAHLSSESYAAIEPYLNQVLEIVPQGENQA